MMVYCSLINRDGRTSATYAFGGSAQDMTGRITFFSDGRQPIIEAQPNHGEVSKLWIGKLLFKYRESLNKGDFKQKMAYEC